MTSGLKMVTAYSGFSTS